MVPEEKIKEQIKYTLKETDFRGLGERRKGKVRDIYVADDKLFLIATDRQSAFDRNLANIPFKGQVLTQTSLFWFSKTKNIIENHVISSPDPNVVMCKKLKVFPVEVVVRAYMTGSTETSIWMMYNEGKRKLYGYDFPDGMKKNQKLDRPILTPTTKGEKDEKLTCEEVHTKGYMTKKQWDFVAEKALELFHKGTEIAAKNGLILVDTKYEFGHDEEGNIFLIDEIHTPDSSRFWIRETYEKKFAEDEEPDNIDKEFLRLWFAKNCDPYKDKELPDAPEELIIELSKRYQQLYEMITGQEFRAEVGDVSRRIEDNLAGII